MKPSELKVKLAGVGLTFDELLMLEMIRDMEIRNGLDVVGVKIMDVVVLSEQSKLASPATTYKYIQSLNNKILISKQVDERDARDLTVNGLRFLLDGDIERVVACALARDPHDRYPSITEFAEDLRRYLENRLVLARRQTAAYRLRKYVSRNRTLLALSAVLLLFAAIAVLFGWQERERAIAQGRRAQASSAVLLWHISSSNPI